MKYFIAIILFGSTAFAYDIQVKDGLVVTNKYILNGMSVWDDTQKQSILNSSVDTGTGTVQDSDFVPTVVPVIDQNIINDMNSDGVYATRSKVIQEIQTRKTKVYIVRQMQDLESKFLALIRVSNIDNADVSSSTQAIVTQLQTLRTRYAIGQ